MIKTLPQFKGWTVDERLGQFRRIKQINKHFACMEYLNFETEKGNKILNQYIKTLESEGAK
jgi:hypothetical protein